MGKSGNELSEYFDMRKVLQLTNKPVWPASEGGPIAMNAMTDSLLALGCNVRVLSVRTHKFPSDESDAPEEYRNATDYETIFVDTRVKPFGAFLSLISKGSYNVSRFYDARYASRLMDILAEKKYELVLLESLFMSPYLPLIRKSAPSSVIVLRAHNIEHRIWERIAAGEKNLLKRCYLKHLAKRLRLAETVAAKKFDGIISISEVDADWFRHAAPAVPVCTIPFGTEINKADQIILPSRSLRLYHLGSMNWWPNIEAVDWLLNECWKNIHKELSGVELHIAGRNMPERLLKTEMEGLTVHGEIDDPATFISQMHILVAPLFSGSGIRIKILEAMAMGKVVITTPIGAEGINYVNGEHLLIINNTDEFRHAVKLILDQPTEMERIGNNARKLVMNDFSHEKVTELLKEFINMIVR